MPKISHKTPYKNRANTIRSARAKQIISQGILSVLGVLLGLAIVACDSQPDPYPTYTPASPAGISATPDGQPAGEAFSQPTPHPTDDPNLRDITSSQREQLNQLIGELMENPQILAECAAEAGDAVPAPGSPGEADWYTQAAIKYSACAVSKATGVDFTGGN